MKNLPVSSQRKRAILKLRDLISFILNYVPNNVTRTSYSHDTYFKKKERKAWSCQEMLDGTIERYRGFNPPDRRKRVFESASERDSFTVETPDGFWNVL